MKKSVEEIREFVAANFNDGDSINTLGVQFSFGAMIACFEMAQESLLDESAEGFRAWWNNQSHEESASRYTERVAGEAYIAATLASEKKHQEDLEPFRCHIEVLNTENQELKEALAWAMNRLDSLTEGEHEYVKELRAKYLENGK